MPHETVLIENKSENQDRGNVIKQNFEVKNIKNMCAFENGKNNAGSLGYPITENVNEFLVKFSNINISE